MGVVTGGGGGGAAFNGGTITRSLEIDGSGVGTNALVVKAEPTGIAGVIDAQTFNGVSSFSVSQGGGVEIEADSDSEDCLQVFSKSTHTGALINVFQNFSPFATLWQLNKGGYMGVRVHSAPANGDVATGECMVWFDQTNGAAKLMLKGKTADGTVVTGSVNLA